MNGRKRSHLVVGRCTNGWRSTRNATKMFLVLTNLMSGCSMHSRTSGICVMKFNIRNKKKDASDSDSDSDFDDQHYPDYTVRGQGQWPLARGRPWPCPKRVRVGPELWWSGPALMGSRASTSCLARPGLARGWPDPTMSWAGGQCVTVIVFFFSGLKIFKRYVTMWQHHHRNTNLHYDDDARGGNIFYIYIF